MTDPTTDQPQSTEPAAPVDRADPRADPTPPRRPRPTGPVQYRGDDLSPERGPGLGCFRLQLIILVFFIILTPLSVVWNWPFPVSAALLFAVIGLLLVTGQTIIFLLRLVAADRRGRRRPLASDSKTVGELEDAGLGSADGPDASPPEGPAPTQPGDATPARPDDGPPAEDPVRQ